MNAIYGCFLLSREVLCVAFSPLDHSYMCMLQKEVASSALHCGRKVRLHTHNEITNGHFQKQIHNPMRYRLKPANLSILGMIYIVLKKLRLVKEHGQGHR